MSKELPKDSQVGNEKPYLKMHNELSLRNKIKTRKKKFKGHFCVHNEFTEAPRTHNSMDKKKIGYLLNTETTGLDSCSHEMIRSKKCRN